MVLMKNHYIPIEQGNADSEKPPSSYVATGTNSSATANTTSATGSPPIPRHKERAPIAINIPPFVTKLEDTKAGGQYLCNPCQAHCNSDIQLSQHLSSKKHMEKVSRKMMISNGSMGEVLVPVAEVTGRAPGKVTVFCSICKLAFSSQVVLDTHINGSKHQRKLKSIELMKSLEGTEPGFKFDSVKGQVCCTLCDVTFYSPQHIARHVAGEKHQSEKGKRENGEEGGTPAKKHCSSSVDTSGLESGSEATESAISTIPTTSSGTGSSAPNFRKKERPLIAINVPACVTKLEDTRAGGKFLCVPCQAHCNSDIQLSQHLSSKKHLDKIGLFCEVCCLAFSSQVLLDSHLSGSKHERRLKSIELLQSLEGVEPNFEFDSVSGEIHCTLCDVVLYSPQHIAKHIEGGKHTSGKEKIKDGEEGNSAPKLHYSGTTEQSCADSGQPNSGSQATNTTVTTTSTNTTAINLPPPLPRKKERPPIALNIPAYVTKLEDTRAGGKFLCNPCQVTCNSDIQLSQHLSSKKHSDKLSGKKRPPTNGRGNWRGWRGGPFVRGRGGASNRPQKIDSLSSSSAFHNSTSGGCYSHSTFPESALSSGYSDSYGLSSLGRGTVSDYGFGRSGSRGRGSGGALGRNETCARSDGDYGRGTSAYSRAENHSRSEYGANFPQGRTEEMNSYSRAATDYAAQGYGSGQNMGHASGRGMPFTYTQPLSQNFVSGGTIL